jgi:hypothetical protein
VAVLVAGSGLAGASPAWSSARCTIGARPGVGASQVAATGPDSAVGAVGAEDCAGIGGGVPGTDGWCTAPENIRCIGSARTVVDVGRDSTVGSVAGAPGLGWGVNPPGADEEAEGRLPAKVVGEVQAALRWATCDCGVDVCAYVVGHGTGWTTCRCVAGPPGSVTR